MRERLRLRQVCTATFVIDTSGHGVSPEDTKMVLGRSQPGPVISTAGTSLPKSHALELRRRDERSSEHFSIGSLEVYQRLWKTSRALYFVKQSTLRENHELERNLSCSRNRAIITSYSGRF